ncbi:hypothetical protein FLL45_09045 [Aliikangiella marina]|uniref:Uncharacterized protein n=1 Tax=Aliikangiella marina TaxID=1712262 RepID=A0A545TCZ0_9GAMM|nr:hypothetical protein [Aliikangiella marina]TQV75077.1 hypothetical protein FLL45_09045 [Aliikangiella marina]
MHADLLPQDIQFIWDTVHQAVEEAGSHNQLFSNGVEMFEDNGRFKVVWPDWLKPVQAYLTDKYSNQPTDALMFSIIREIMSEHKYSAFLKKQDSYRASTKTVTYADC